MDVIFDENLHRQANFFGRLIYLLSALKGHDFKDKLKLNIFADNSIWYYTELLCISKISFITQDKYHQKFSLIASINGKMKHLSWIYEHTNYQPITALYVFGIESWQLFVVMHILDPQLLIVMLLSYKTRALTLQWAEYMFSIIYNLVQSD